MKSVILRLRNPPPIHSRWMLYSARTLTIHPLSAMLVVDNTRYLSALQRLQGNCTVHIIPNSKTATPPQSAGIPGAVGAVGAMEAPELTAAAAPPLEAPEALEAPSAANLEAEGKVGHVIVRQVEKET